jgi:hypothetical protein
MRAALDVLDNYHTAISDRDPTKSLNEDPQELLLRVRRALEPLIFNGASRRDDVAEIAKRIDDCLATYSAVAQSPVPYSGRLR